MNDVHATPICVFIVDDHDVFVANLVRTLTAEDDLRVIGTARSISEARWTVVNKLPDVVLINQRLPDGDALAAASELQVIQPRAQFLLLTTSAKDDVLVRAIEAGACGFVEKSQSPSAICSAVRAAHGGDAVVSRPVLARLLELMCRRPEVGRTRLNERERALLVLMAEGLTNAEIAEREVVSLCSVRLHVDTLSAKLGAYSRLEALSVACRPGLLPRDDSKPVGRPTDYML